MDRKKVRGKMKIKKFLDKHKKIVGWLVFFFLWFVCATIIALISIFTVKSFERQLIFDIAFSSLANFKLLHDLLEEWKKRGAAFEKPEC